MGFSSKQSFHYWRIQHSHSNGPSPVLVNNSHVWFQLPTTSFVLMSARLKQDWLWVPGKTLAHRNNGEVNKGARLVSFQAYFQAFSCSYVNCLTFCTLDVETIAGVLHRSCTGRRSHTGTPISTGTFSTASRCSWQACCHTWGLVSCHCMHSRSA